MRLTMLAAAAAGAFAVALSATVLAGPASATTVTFSGGAFGVLNGDVFYREKGMEFISSGIKITQDYHPSFTGLVGLSNGTGGDQIEFFLADGNYFKLDSILFSGNPDGGGHTLITAFTSAGAVASTSVGGGSAGIDFSGIPAYSHINDVQWCGHCIDGFDTLNAMLSVTFDEIKPNSAPEPATLLLFGSSALAGLALRRRATSAA